MELKFIYSKVDEVFFFKDNILIIKHLDGW